MSQFGKKWKVGRMPNLHIILSGSGVGIGAT